MKNEIIYYKTNDTGVIWYHALQTYFYQKNRLLTVHRTQIKIEYTKQNSIPKHEKTFDTHKPAITQEIPKDEFIKALEDTQENINLFKSKITKGGKK